MSTSTWVLSAAALVLSSVGVGFVVGHLTAPEPIETVVFVPHPEGDYIDLPVRIMTGDGTGYRYECDVTLSVAEPQEDVAVCHWPDAEDVSSLPSP